MGLAYTTGENATGPLREVYARMLERSSPAVLRPANGGVPGFVAMHSLDPQLIPRVFAAAATLDETGPLSWPERELVKAITSRSNHSAYGAACHAEFLRVALEHDEALAKAVIADPRGVALSWRDPRVRMIAELAVGVTVAPWSLARDQMQRAHKAGLDDDAVLHVIALSCYGGHLDRIANAVQVALDYNVRLPVPAADPRVAPWAVAPKLVVGRPAVDIALRPATANAFTEWKHYIFYSHDAPLTRRQRTLIARWVATWLGDGGISSPTDLTVNPIDDALRAIAEVVTLAPWRISDETFSSARARGFDDAMLFDICATATSAGVFSRLEVALVALAT